VSEDNDVIFAVGDIHGCKYQLLALQSLIAAEAIHVGARNPKVVYLGDYVDRGPDSQGVIKAVLEGLSGFERIRLTGNHEDMMLGFVSEPYRDNADHWYSNGGEQTLASYGIAVPRPLILAQPRAIRDRLLAAMPASHRSLLVGRPPTLAVSHENEATFFVHAGVEPNTPFAEQDRDTMLWIRKPFLSSSYDWGKTVVHGHTPSPFGPEIRPNRINVDTLAYDTGNLTAVVLDGGFPRFLVAAPACGYHVLVDPLGRDVSAWLQWSVARAKGAHALKVALCLSEAATPLAEELFRAAGIETVLLSRHELVGKLADNTSNFVNLIRTGRITLAFSCAAAREDIYDAVEVATAQSGRSYRT
jgi:serine/threonine protein phosphatase 1